MTWKETNSKYNVRGRKEAISQRLKRSFEMTRFGELDCFVYPTGGYFMLDAFVKFGAIVVGYADTEEDARLYRFEDGDLFYLEDLDEEEMFQKILEEINREMNL